VDAFACPASFPWNSSKSVSKDPFPKSSEFNAEHYATLVAYPTTFHKYPEPFLCLIEISHIYTLDEDTYPQFLYESGEEMDLFSFIRTANPTKVRVGERQRAEDEPKLSDTTVGRVVPLLPVAPARGESELKDSVDKLFNEGGSGDQAGDNHEASSGPTVGGKSRLAVQHLLATPEHKEGDHTESLAGTNLRTIGAPHWFVISIHSSHHSSANIAEAEVDSFARTSVPLMTLTTTVTSTVDPTTTAKEKLVESSVFGGGSSSGAEHTVGGFSSLTGSDFIVGGIRTVVSPDTNLQKVYVPQ
ncbi:hypothetical protein Tco_1480306, partial [Tanacetum coccineum]